MSGVERTGDYPEISFKVVIFGQTVKEYYTYLLEYFWKNIPNNFFLFLSLSILIKSRSPPPPHPPSIFKSASFNFRVNMLDFI